MTSSLMHRGRRIVPRPVAGPTMSLRHAGLGLLLMRRRAARSRAKVHHAQTSRLPGARFPEPGLDDTASYQGYQTRFYRDSKQNTVQVYLEPTGRSGGDPVGRCRQRECRLHRARRRRPPGPLDLGAPGRTVRTARDGQRSIEYRLLAGASRIELGGFLLGSMRVERDYQYAKRHLQPLTHPPFRGAGGIAAGGGRGPAPAAERSGISRFSARQHRDAALPARADFDSACSDTLCTVRVERPSLDGRNRLALELRVDPRRVKVQVQRRERFPSGRGRVAPVRFAVKVTTDAAPLTPLARDEIFNPDFLQFLAEA